MYLYILFSILTGWILWRICTGFWLWWTLRQSVKSVPLLTGNHWLFGLLHKVQNMDDFINHCQLYIDNKPTRWFKVYFLFLHPIVVPTHPDSIRVILSASGVPKNHRTMGGVYNLFRPWIGDGLLVSNGAKWERNRSLLTPAFHFDILKQYLSTFSEVTDIFLDLLQTASDNKSSLDVFPLVSRLTLHNMLRCTLSYDDKALQNTDDQHPYVEAISNLKSLFVQRLLNPLLAFDWVFAHSATGKEFKKHSDFIHDFAEKIIAARKKAIAQDDTLLQKKHLDFLDILLTAEDSDGSKLTDKEIRDEVDTFLFEGHDTTASAVSWALHSLAKYPEYQLKVREEVKQVFNGKKDISGEDLSMLSYTTCFLKESMRMNTPVPGFSRILNRPIKVEGITLLKGQQIDLYPHFVHHNPLVWEDHMEFKPERFLPENIDKKDPYAFLPFSAGQRNCIGQHFAMNEVKVIISKVVQRFEIHLDPDRKARLFPEVIMGAKDGIYLYFTELGIDKRH